MDAVGQDGLDQQFYDVPAVGVKSLVHLRVNSYCLFT